MKTFRVPKDIVFGWGSLEYLKEIKGKRAFIVTDKICKDLGLADRVSAYLEEAGLETNIYTGTEPDPSRVVVENGAKKMSEFGPDWVVGLGGGSPIDAAKAMWIFYEHPDITWDKIILPLSPPALRNKARFIAISTTSGTGTEVSCASVITNREAELPVKEVIASGEITADIAIADSELASSMPPKVTADTGMDVLTHAIEAYTSILASEVDRALASRAIQLVYRSLVKAYADGRNQAAREDMHTASMMAAMAFTNAFLGIVHSCAHQIGSQYGVPHGLANSIMLPYVLKYNMIAVSDQYAEIARAIGIESDNDRDATLKLIDSIFQLQEDVGQPHTIKGLGVDEKEFFEKLQATSENAMNDVSVPPNPRVPTVEDLKQIYTVAYHGE